MERARPPEDISPEAFFEEWVPRRVAEDERRKRALGGTWATIQFELTDPDGARHAYSVHIRDGEVEGKAGRSPDPNLRVFLSLEDWRDLNAGRLSAPEAFLRQKVRLVGDLVLAVKLHLILG